MYKENYLPNNHAFYLILILTTSDQWEQQKQSPSLYIITLIKQSE